MTNRGKGWLGAFVVSAIIWYVLLREVLRAMGAL